jgi:preprotein translocase subunit SecA
MVLRSPESAVMHDSLIIPTNEYRRGDLPAPRELYRGTDAVVHRWLGRAASRGSIATRLHAIAEEVQKRVGEVAALTEEQLTGELQWWQHAFRRGEPVTDDVMRKALAVVAECARRLLGLRAHTVQLMGSLAAIRGGLIEMATGEGKTLSVSLAAVFAGWTGRPCHVLTANDYLAERDAEWLGPFYRACGLTAGCVLSEMGSADRRENYACGITYTTSKEVVADFLRDRIHLGPRHCSASSLLQALGAGSHAGLDGLVQRGLHTAIVDEADSALIDEAVTPLIISRKHDNEPLRQACVVAHDLASALQPGEDYRADVRTHEVVLLRSGLAKLHARAESLPGMWRGEVRRSELVVQALRAREFFQRGKQYVVIEDKVVIVDEFTGRMMPQRTWREGLHQAVEAKEGLAVSTPDETLARLSFQRFFRLYRKLSGLSGTAWEAAEEAWHMYRLPVIRIPTDRPCQRVKLPDRIFATADAKWAGVVDEIAHRHARGQPVLIGTRNVRASEHLAEMLAAVGLPFALLNATRHREEAAIVAAAGEPGRITIATNMAGRGTDILLGPGVAANGGLHVILTERHGSRRIDRQFIGRAARHGDPGSAQAFVSLDDELIQRHAPRWWRNRIRAALTKRRSAAEWLAKSLIHRAQRHSERSAYRQRRQVLEMDRWVDDSLAFSPAETP